MNARTKKPYAVFKRKNGKIYYVQFLKLDGTYSDAITTRETAKGRAESFAIDYLKKTDGRIINNKKLTFEEFSNGFFNWNNSWALNKRATGKRLSERQCQANQSQINNIVNPAIGKIKITDIDENIIENFRNNLFKQDVSGSSINKILSNLNSVLKAAYKQSLIYKLPEVEKVAINENNKKGILSVEKIRELFSTTWPDYRAYVMNLTAAASGLRRGELLGLQIKNFHSDYIEVEKSYDEKMKRLNTTTKNGKTRRVIIPVMVKIALEKLIDTNPYREPDSFIFFSENRERPIHGEYVNTCLYRAMKKIGIDEITRKENGYCFHMWRVFFNSWLINARVPLAKIMSLTGHITPAMAQETYYRLDDLEDIKQLQESIFTDAQIKA